MVFSIHDVEGFDLLRWEDQQKIRKYVESFPDQTSKTNALNTELEYSIEVSQTSRRGLFQLLALFFEITKLHLYFNFYAIRLWLIDLVLYSAFIVYMLLVGSYMYQA